MCERKIDVGANEVRRKSAAADTNRARPRRRKNTESVEKMVVNRMESSRMNSVYRLRMQKQRLAMRMLEFNIIHLRKRVKILLFPASPRRRLRCFFLFGLRVGLRSFYRWMCHYERWMLMRFSVNTMMVAINSHPFGFVLKTGGKSV